MYAIITKKYLHDLGKIVKVTTKTPGYCAIEQDVWVESLQFFTNIVPTSCLVFLPELDEDNEGDMILTTDPKPIKPSNFATL